MQYVVHSEPPRGEEPFDKPDKAFSNHHDASQFAEAEVRGDAFEALIYETSAGNAAEAVAMVRQGKAGAPIDVKTKKSVPGVDRPFSLEELGF